LVKADNLSRLECLKDVHFGKAFLALQAKIRPGWKVLSRASNIKLIRR
jgi:hypothetical protein